MRHILQLLLFIFTVTTLSALGGNESAGAYEESSKDISDSALPLPSPRSEGEVSLEESLNNREVLRRYSSRPLSLEDLSQLLWAGSGTKVDAVSGPTRTAPSAGGLYPQELFVFVGDVEGDEDYGNGSIDPGVYRYEFREHQMVQLYSEDLREELARAALDQSFIAEAPAVILIGGVAERTAKKYGERGSERYMYMDAAHSAQNISLQSAALGLASGLIGAFDDEEVSDLIGTTEASPLYIIPVGQPR
ncbi:MAG: SagB/ThcOx family dehydrogenase [Spirochaetia bacterium]